MAKISKTQGSGRTGYPYWLIVNKKRGSVWQGSRETCTFSSLAAAEAEFRKQVALLKPGQRHGYEIERVDAPGGGVAAIEESKESEVASLERAAGHSLPYKDEHHGEE